jgi:hypothetical protein
MASFMQIPKTTSSPENPSAPSFLTSLSPEIRNAIYEILFLRDESVLVHNAQSYHATEPERDYFNDPDMFEAEIQHFEHTFEDDIGGDVDFSYGFHLGVPFLRSCRQIYHESVGIFYGCNEFIISRALNRHDVDHHRPYDKDEYWQLLYASVWLSRLGSQASLLRTVVVDVDPMCPAHCPHSKNEFDILPFVRFLWFQANENCSLVFAHTGRELSGHKVHTGASSTPKRKRADTYNNILNALVKQDILGFKIFGQPKRFLKAISVSTWDDVASIHYADKKRNYSHLDHLEISDAGRMLRVKHPSQEGNRLLSMSWDILYQIFSHVRSSYLSSEVVFDLNSRTVHGLAMNILQVSKEMRSEEFAPFSAAMRIPITVKASANKIITAFNHFVALRDLGVNDRRNRSRKNVFPNVLVHGSIHTHVKILLHISPPERTLLSEIRINIKGLIDSFSNQYLGPNISVQITSSYSNGQSSYEETTTLNLTELLQRVFLLLSDVLATSPIKGRERFREGLPSIWLDGNGTILKASYPMTIKYPALSVPNRHAQLRLKEVDFRGYNLAADLSTRVSYERTILESNGYETPRSLISVWSDLRELYWADHEIRRPRARDI